MNFTETPARALVLGGGGSAGNAWLIGVLAGLADAGLDVTDADLVIGTSAGATAAAQVGNEPLPVLLRAIFDSPPALPPAPSGGGRAPVGSLHDHLDRTGRIIAASTDPADMRRRMGAAFIDLDAATSGSGTPRWRAVVDARLPGYTWPQHRLLLTAVDADTGTGLAFDRDSGIDLVDAVAASTSGGSAYRIGDRRFIDGGYRRNENADLANGFSRVLILSPFGGRTRHPLSWGMQLDAQVAELRASGSRVAAILPGEASRLAFGGNMMAPSARPAAARAGLDQGRAMANPLAGLWH